MEGLADGETLNGSLARKDGENAGSYQITLGTLASDPVYDVTFTEGTFTIQKKKLKASELSVKEKPAAREKLVEDGKPEHVDFMELYNIQLRALTGGDVTKESTVLSLECWRALTELDAKAREAEELEKIRNKH